MTRTALRAALSVQRSAGSATVVHRARKPTGHQGAQAKDADRNGDVQKRVGQPLYFSLNS